MPNLAAFPASTVRPLAGLACCTAITDVRRDVDADGEPLLLEGEVLDGRYRLSYPLARSGMSTLYRAQEIQTGREVAIKLPLARIEADPSGFVRFRNEEELSQELDHRSLLKVFPSAAERSRPYLVMELLEGCTLSHLRKHTPISEPEALALCALICDAVGAMHQKGILHCDLQPTNVMLCCDRTLRVIDFGLARRRTPKPSVAKWFVEVFGTPEYMAPEQVVRDPLSEASDVYSIGAILYELLTDCVPFEHKDPHRSAFLRTRGDPSAPSVLAPAVSPQAEEIVLRALRRKPSERYASTEAFARDLRAPERVIVSGLAGKLTPPRWTFSMRETPVLAGVLLAIGGVGALVGFFEVLKHAAAHR